MYSRGVQSSGMWIGRRIVLLATLWIRNFPFLLLKSIAGKIWVKFGLLDTLSNEDGLFFFQFDEAGAYKQVVDSCPWHFGRRLIVLQQW